MIKNLFIPDKIGTYYIFSERIASIEITKTQVYGCRVNFTGSRAVIERCVDHPIEMGTGNNYQERAAQAARVVLDKIGAYDALYSCIPGSFMVFKTLKLPFVEYEKIKMVVAYEIEPLLPFTLHDAIIDFIVMQTFEDNSAQVLAIAIQKQHIADQVALFEQAGAHLSAITVDVLALFNLYKEIPTYTQTRGNVAILDYRVYETRLIYLKDGQIISMRFMPKGLIDQAKAIGQQTQLSTTQVLEQLFRFGITKPEDDLFLETTKKILHEFLGQIKFTINSFIAQDPLKEPFEQLLLLGDSAQIKGLESFMAQVLEVPVSLFQLQDLVHNKHITVKHNTALALPYAGVIGSALSARHEHPINLLQKEFAPDKRTLLLKQFFTALALIVILLGSLIGFGFYTTNRLKKEATNSGAQAIRSLQDAFKNKLKIDTKRDIDKQLRKAVDDAKKEVTEQKKLWFSFDSPTHVSFLQYLLELATKIDKEGLGLTINTLAFDEEKLIFKGSVKTYDAATLLKQIFRQSKLFGAINPPGELDKLSFNAEIELIPDGKDEE